MTKSFGHQQRQWMAWILVFLVLAACDCGVFSAFAAERDCDSGRHSYEDPAWQWAEDYEFATAVFVCADCGDRLAKAADMAAPRVREATCDQEGKVVYAATVMLDGMLYRDTRAVTLPETAHDYVYDYCRVCGAEDPYRSTGECAYLEEMELENGSFVLTLGGLRAGRFLFRELEEGWAIRNADGLYLTMEIVETEENEETEPGDGVSAGYEVCLNYSETSFVWEFREGGFGVSVELPADAVEPEATEPEESAESTEPAEEPAESVFYLTLENDALTLSQDPEAAQAAVCVEKFRSSHRYGDGEEAEATCEEPGGIRYTCIRCGHRDYENPTDPLGHTYTEWTVVSEGSCLTDGIRHRECQTCGKVETEYDPAGHSYSVTWNWTGDYSACTAQIQCGVCAEGTEGHSAAVEAFVYTETVEPDYEFAGEMRYIAEAEYNGELFTDVLSEEIPRLIAPVPVIGLPDFYDFSGKTYGCQVEETEKVIYLDIHKDGITVEELLDALDIPLEYDSDDTAELRVDGTVNFRDEEIVTNGAVLTIVAENLDERAEESWRIVILGDTNRNGRVESGDAVKMNRHYAGTEVLDETALMAADTNRNGRIDSGDAVKNRIKYTTETAPNYRSALS